MNKEILSIAFESCVSVRDRKTDSCCDVEYLIEEYDDLIVLSFRATEASSLFKELGIIDVIRNLNIFPEKHLGSTFHKGFLSGWRGVKSRIYRDISHKKKPILVTGHSLGGALSLCAAHDIIRDLDLKGVVTFGAPRCVNLHKGTYLNDEIVNRTIQFQHVGDAVPGYMSYTCYKHIDNTFIGGDIRKSWLKRSWDFHDLELYDPAKN
jgi:hypothetical protein